jgi:hypothetical protein
MFYLISIEYVGPNTLDSKGNIIGDSETVQITTTPPRTNMSDEVMINGWLGTTNDWSSHALGEFKTLEDALSELKSLGFTSEVESEENGVFSEWQKPSAALEKWSAGDWLLNSLGREGICKEYCIAAETTDEELEKISERMDSAANEDGINLFGSMDLIVEIRDDLID